VQSFEEEEPQFLGEEGKWIFLPAYSFCPNNKHFITLQILYVVMHKFVGKYLLRK
jgi:hypothetical protein